jgi:hypothetical protein
MKNEKLDRLLQDVYAAKQRVIAELTNNQSAFEYMYTDCEQRFSEFERSMIRQAITEKNNLGLQSTPKGGRVEIKSGGDLRGGLVLFIFDANDSFVGMRLSDTKDIIDNLDQWL